MNWETGSEGPLLVSARVTRTRGKLLVEQRITNTGLTPLSQLELRLLYDHGELRPHGLDRVAVSHLLPGDSHSGAGVSYKLLLGNREPRQFQNRLSFRLSQIPPTVPTSGCE